MSTSTPSPGFNRFVAVVRRLLALNPQDADPVTDVTLSLTANPLWCLTVNLRGTPLANETLARTEIGGESENFADGGEAIGPWMSYGVKAGQFEGVSELPDLDLLLGAFADWAESRLQAHQRSNTTNTC